MSEKKNPHSASRRDFIGAAAAITAAQVIGTALPTVARAEPKPKKKKKTPSSRPNFLFVFTDQERAFSKWPSGFRLPGHERLAREGVTFKSHQVSATMCTSSRAVMLTGLQTPDNKMFENSDMPYVNALSTQTPTIGHMLREAGYYTAYKGKWHLDGAFDGKLPEKELNARMDAYGFSDFNSPGDALAHTLGGYQFDHLIGGSAISWLRRKGKPLSEEGRPWALFVSLINPHDIMYFNADAPDENVQDTGRLLMHAAKTPDHADYRKTWNSPLPANLKQPIEEDGRPKAHSEFHKAWGYNLGHIPLKEANWRRFHDFYLNSIKQVDLQLASLLNELEALDLEENTVVIFTADHGEMAGSHGLRGKGPFAYKESVHVPLYVVHPDVPGGQDCHALTSHIDLVPTILSMAGVSKQDASKFAKRDLPGKDLSPVLADAKHAGPHAVRDKALFTYSGLVINDSEVVRLLAEAKASGDDPRGALKKSGYKPNFKNRGSLRSIFDGRYRFTRYFSPMERQSPKNLDDLFANNDVELFDLKNDPEEMKNLALHREANKALLLEMNAKLEAAIKEEIGVDDGREMPKFPNIQWTIDRVDL